MTRCTFTVTHRSMTLWIPMYSSLPRHFPHEFCLRTALPCVVRDVRGSLLPGGITDLTQGCLFRRLLGPYRIRAQLPVGVGRQSLCSYADAADFHSSKYLWNGVLVREKAVQHEACVHNRATRPSLSSYSHHPDRLAVSCARVHQVCLLTTCHRSRISLRWRR